MTLARQTLNNHRKSRPAPAKPKQGQKAAQYSYHELRGWAAKLWADKEPRLPQDFATAIQRLNEYRKALPGD
jgi:hypothetical protein